MSMHIVTAEEQYEGVYDVRGPYFSEHDARTAAQEFARLDQEMHEWRVYAIERMRSMGDALATYCAHSQNQYEAAKAEDRERFPGPKREPTPVYMPGHELTPSEAIIDTAASVCKAPCGLRDSEMRAKAVTELQARAAEQMTSEDMAKFIVTVCEAVMHLQPYALTWEQAPYMPEQIALTPFYEKAKRVLGL